jgi:hypothetical protein
MVSPTPNPRPRFTSDPPDGVNIAELNANTSTYPKNTGPEAATDPKEISHDDKNILQNLQNLYSVLVSNVLSGHKKINDENKEDKEAAIAVQVAKAQAVFAKAQAEQAKRAEQAEQAKRAAAAVEQTKGLLLENDVLSEKIRCIEYSIKKLELDLRLTNEDSIGTEEFENVLLEINKLSNNVSNTCFQRITIDEFKANARMKRMMNSYAAMIKMASFICPVLAIANKSALMRLTEATKTMTDITPDITQKQIEQTKSVCSTIIMTMLDFASVENGEILETASTALDIVGKGHDVGVIEAVYNAVGITAEVTTTLGGKIGNAIEEVYTDYIINNNTRGDATFYAANAIRNYFKIATKSQQIVATASLILLIMFTLLNVVEGKFDGLIKMINEGSTKLLELAGGKRTKSKAKTTKPPKTPTKPPKTPTKPPKTPTKPPKTPKAVPKKKK